MSEYDFDVNTVQEVDDDFKPLPPGKYPVSKLCWQKHFSVNVFQGVSEKISYYCGPKKNFFVK